MIFVKTIGGKTYSIPVNPYDPVISIKEYLYDLGFTYDYCEYTLIFAGKQLEEHHIITEMNIALESTIYIINTNIILFIQKYASEPFKLIMPIKCTILDIKLKIKDLEGIEVKNQILTYNGKELEYNINSATSYYNISSKSILQLEIREMLEKDNNY